MRLDADDAPALLGVHPWDSRLALFERLTTGNDRRLWIQASRSISGHISGADIERWAPWDSEDWHEEIPRWMKAIAQAELQAAGAGSATIAVLSSTSKHELRVGADREFQAEYARIAAAFLDDCEKGIAPQPGPDDLEIVKRLWPDDDAGEVALPAAAGETWDRIKALRKMENDAEKRRRQLEASLRFAVGAHRFGVLPNGRRLKLAVQADRLGRVGRRLVEVG